MWDVHAAAAFLLAALTIIDQTRPAPENMAASSIAGLACLLT
jgi:hypothetical protein